MHTGAAVAPPTVVKSRLEMRCGHRLRRAHLIERRGGEPARPVAAKQPDDRAAERDAEPDQLRKLVPRIGLFEGRMTVHEMYPAQTLLNPYGSRVGTSTERRCDENHSRRNFLTSTVSELGSLPWLENSGGRCANPLREPLSQIAGKAIVGSDSTS